MSGRKTSTVDFRAERARAVRASAGAHEAVEEARAMVEELRAAVACDQANEAFAELLSRLRKTLAEAEEVAARAKRLLKPWTISLTKVQQAVAECDKVLATIRALRTEVVAARANLGSQAEVAGLSAQLDAQERSMGRWDAGLLAAIRDRCGQAVQQLDADTRDGRRSPESQAAVTRLRADLDQFVQSVRQREIQEEGRNVVIAALEESCVRLGYTVEHASEEDPNAPRRFQVNTGAYGIIAFELSLDAVLSTSSPTIQPRICENWVERFEEQMGRLGVMLEFRYQETGEPVRRGKAERGFDEQQQCARQAEGS